ncbi:ABC transporter substrate-binding protein [Microlunatus parietis]|uniref:Multiple sugar transport system substrate-binding protein n=1 Tax=Microlunatus parietis TaxID=682979 RepID=A0A7Y9LCG7_9ACTN|nr:sugar ABC transporter substrate-binding protein [Microlunatus parietis]NYE72827.1 multiple sugar transport system substrate-binding protein [Microlunatus parietis]
MSRTFPRRTLLISAAGTVALSACGNQEPTPSAPGEKVELVYRLWDEQQEVGYQDVFEAFTAENPDITVRMELLPWDQYWTKLTAELASGNGPDVFWLTVDRFPDLASKGVLAPIQDQLAEAGIDLANYHPNVVNSYKYEDQQYGMPKDLGVVGMLYNKDLIKKAGVDEPGDLEWKPDGSGSFEELARKLTVDKAGRTAGEAGFDPAKIKQWGFLSWNHGQTTWLNWIAGNGGQVKDPATGTFAYASPKSVEALQWARDLIFTWHVSPDGTRTNPPTGQATEMFYRGEVAMFDANNALLPFALPEVKFEIGVAPIPKGPAGRSVMINGLGEVAYAASKHPEQTMKLIMFLGSEKAQKIMGDAGYVIPALNGASDGYVAYWKGKGIDVTPYLESAAGTTFNMPVGEDWVAKDPEINKAASDLFLNKTPVAEVAAKMDEIANES